VRSFRHAPSDSLRFTHQLFSPMTVFTRQLCSLVDCRASHTRQATHRKKLWHQVSKALPVRRRTIGTPVRPAITALGWARGQPCKSRAKRRCKRPQRARSRSPRIAVPAVLRERGPRKLLSEYGHRANLNAVPGCAGIPCLFTPFCTEEATPARPQFYNPSLFTRPDPASLADASESCVNQV
jgi:hypothetical protein